MATTLEELQNLMRNPGMSRTPVGTISSPGGNRDVPGPPSSVGRGRTQKRASASATGSTRANVRRPGISAGVSSVPTANPATRVQNALNIMDSPVQRSRTSTEAAANPLIGEALRRSLIEQQRVSGPTFGSMGALDRRDRQRSINNAQTAVDSNLSAMQGIREGALTDRGQSLEATTLLEDRQMQEAGAFDRALLGLDEAMLKGQFGLAGIAAENADPLRDLAVDVITQQVAGEDATALDRMNAVNAALRLAAQQGAGPAVTFETDGMGNIMFKGSGTTEDLVAARVEALGGPNSAAGRRYLTQQGIAMTEDGRFISLEEADARAAAATESAEELAAAERWLRENAPFIEQQRKRRSFGGSGVVDRSPQTLFPDQTGNPGVGVR